MSCSSPSFGSHRPDSDFNCSSDMFMDLSTFDSGQSGHSSAIDASATMTSTNSSTTVDSMTKFDIEIIMKSAKDMLMVAEVTGNPTLIEITRASYVSLRTQFENKFGIVL